MTLNTSFFLAFLAVLDLNAFVKGAIEGFLSSLALMIFFAILPLVSMEIHFNVQSLRSSHHQLLRRVFSLSLQYLHVQIAAKASLTRTLATQTLLFELVVFGKY